MSPFGTEESRNYEAIMKENPTKHANFLVCLSLVESDRKSKWGEMGPTSDGQDQDIDSQDLPSHARQRTDSARASVR